MHAQTFAKVRAIRVSFAEFREALVDYLTPLGKLKKSEVYEEAVLENSPLEQALYNFEERQLIPGFKFGALYCGAGQSTEEQMFANVLGSPAWFEFMSLISTRIELRNYQGYRGGLDVTSTFSFSFFRFVFEC